MLIFRVLVFSTTLHSLSVLSYMFFLWWVMFILLIHGTSLNWFYLPFWANSTHI
uniref:Uncharacterized protein n=1 Tax=Arundo donax TaxID=35708 RepID=A0A0A9CCS3_ARUDO